jgi:hypothetical protein
MAGAEDELVEDDKAEADCGANAEKPVEDDTEDDIARELIARSAFIDRRRKSQAGSRITNLCLRPQLHLFPKVSVVMLSPSSEVQFYPLSTGIRRPW